MTDLERGPSSDGESAICATSLNKSSSTLVERLRAVVGDDHGHDCPARMVGCSCGYESGRDDLDLEAATLISELQATNLRQREKIARMRADCDNHTQVGIDATGRALAAESALSRIQSETVERVRLIIEPWVQPQTMKLRAGEMTAQEVRSVQAVLSSVWTAIRSLAEKTAQSNHSPSTQNTRTE